MNLYRSMRTAAAVLALATAPMAHATHLIGRGDPALRSGTLVT